MTQTPWFGGLSVWHPDCGTALGPVNTNSSTATRSSTAMRGDHEQAKSRAGSAASEYLTAVPPENPVRDDVQLDVW
jgi:hypothetical protein